jgi:hypothetical protein
MHQAALVGLAALAMLPLLTVTDADAGGRKLKQLRKEVAALRATMARLESEMQIMLRRDASVLPPMQPVVGICTDPCAFDADEDGLGDCEDPCPCEAGNPDRDADGAPDCMDPCPDDPTDACIDPCRMDSDGDASVDCDDPCPWDPAPAGDDDRDGIPDCQDPCPAEKQNDCIEPCPLDADGDGVKDCVDPCPWGDASGRPCATPPQPPTATGGCVVGGCSGQVCSDDGGVVTTCEWLPEYACYRKAACERQADGACGWTLSDELAACLREARRPSEHAGATPR